MLLARLQSDIVESMDWPSIRSELFLSAFMFLQMFKYAYDRFSLYWTSSRSDPPALFFAYFDPAHYESYLPEAVFVNILYIIMGVCGFYILCFIYLLRPVGEGELNSLLLRALKGMLELFSTVLFIPTVKTVLK